MYNANYLGAPPPGAYPYGYNYPPPAPVPAPSYYGGLYRSRSHGHAPAPQVNIYEHISQRTSPNVSPGISPERRGRGERTLGDELAAELALERLDRSRSRGRSDAAYWQLEKYKQEEAEADAVRKYEARKIEEAAEKRRAVDEFRRKEEKEKEERNEMRTKIKLEEEEEARKRKELRDRIRREEEEEAKKKKDEMEEMRERIRLADEKKKREEKEEFEKWQAKMDKEKAEKKKKEEEKKEEIDEEISKRLRKFGFSDNQIEAVNHTEKLEILRRGYGPRDPLLVGFRGHTPKYPKIKKDYLAIDTLIYYGLPWKYAEDDPNYYVIMKEMTRHETDVLFEHTRRLRKGKEALLIEEAKPRKELAFVRRHSRSPNRRSIGIVEVLRK